MELPRTRSGRVKLAAAIAAAIGVYLLVRNALPDLDLQKVLEDVSRSLGEWSYLIAGLFAFLETGAFVGLVVPGETVVVLAGAVAGQGETEVTLTIAIVWASAFLGDTASFFLGAKLGRGFILEHGERLRISRERFARVEEYFDSHGGKTILIGRFIGIVRALAPFIAGSSGMRYSAMAPYSVLGTGLWASAFTLLGFYASQNIDSVLNASERGLFYFGLLVAAVVGTIVAVRFLREPENRERVVAGMERRPLLRPLLGAGRRLAPQGRFLLQRLTPGGLGLELTAPLAALAVGAYVFVAYAIVVGDAAGPTGADRAAADIAAEIRAGWLTSVEEVITKLGAGAALIAVAGAAGAMLLWRRHWLELSVLVVASVALLIAVPELKDMVGRERPDGALVKEDGLAFPSGHAAYSVIYTWLALTVTIRLRPGLPGGTALIVGGLLLTAAVGLSRVYLGVHFLSDVLGGWGLGVAIFALAAAAGVLVTHLRHNPERGA